MTRKGKHYGIWLLVDTLAVWLQLMHLQEEILEGLAVLSNNSRESGEAKYIKRERQALLSFKEGSKDEVGMLSLGPIITTKQITATGNAFYETFVQYGPTGRFDVEEELVIATGL